MIGRRSGFGWLAAWFIAVTMAVGVPGVRAADPPLVQTTAGWVQGVTTGQTREFRGIQFAAPPLEGLRWRPPQPVTPWSGVRDATVFAPPCIQLAFLEPTLGSEDCLYLNVFAPSAAPATPLPVMVHLHPGNNSGFHPYTNATNFVDKGVIVVTVGYRLGVFGFVGHPELSTEGGAPSGEYGLLDQLAALRWVRHNIAAFGGDPGNVTLFGQSAGSFDTVALMVSPLNDRLFHKAVVQTEYFWALNGLGGIEEAEDIGLRMSAGVGCEGTDDVLACLRSTPAEDLVLAPGFVDVHPKVGGLVLPDAPIRLIEQQTDAIPLLVGSDQEESVFVEAATGTYRPQFRALDTHDLAGPQASRVLRDLYPVEAYDSAGWATNAMFSDAIWTCPIRRLALASSGPTYRYLYTHRIENDPFLNSLRAAHFLEEPILWHDAGLLGGFGAADYQFSPAEDLLSDGMATYWTNFARTGDPNGPGVPAWPSYESSTERVLALDTQITVLERHHAAHCDFFDTVPELLDPAQFYARFWVAPRHGPIQWGP